jgi:lysyl-tRNA synthetase class II
MTSVLGKVSHGFIFPASVQKQISFNVIELYIAFDDINFLLQFHRNFITRRFSVRSTDTPIHMNGRTVTLKSTFHV